jgi:predicted N-acyltransferase
MFFLDQDLLQGAGPRVRAFFKRLRKVMPRLAVWRTLMVGCAAGEGHLGLGEDDADQAAMCTLLHRVLKQYARRSHAKMVVLKEFPAEYRPALEKFAANGYVRIPSFPMVRLAIDYADFEAFAEKVIGKATRKDLRRKFKKTAPDSENPVSMEVVEDITAVVEEIYPLYLQVYERSEMRFEKLTKEYMCRLGQEMPETVRFFIWRLRGKAVAMSLCMLQGDRIYDEYLGLDYELALDLNLYFVTLRDVLDWSMKQGLKWYYSSALGYKPKLHFKCELVPLDLYVTHTSRLVNQVLRWILPWLEPTRKDETLKKFPNAASLWGER